MTFVPWRPHQTWLHAFETNSQKSVAISGTENNWRYLPYTTPMVQAYVRQYPHKIWPYMVQYLHFRILTFLLKKGEVKYFSNMDFFKKGGSQKGFTC